MQSLAGLGWLMSYAIVVGLVGPFFGTCTQGADAPWAVGFYLVAPIVALSILLICIGLRSENDWSGWFLPHALSVLIALYVVPFYFWNSTILGLDVCSAREATDFGVPVPWWHRLWAPTYLVLLVVLGVLAMLFRSRSKRHRAHAGQPPNPY